MDYREFLTQNIVSSQEIFSYLQSNVVILYGSDGSKLIPSKWYFNDGNIQIYKRDLPVSLMKVCYEIANYPGCYNHVKPIKVDGKIILEIGENDKVKDPQIVNDMIRFMRSLSYVKMSKDYFYLKMFVLGLPPYLWLVDDILVYILKIDTCYSDDRYLGDLKSTTELIIATIVNILEMYLRHHNMTDYGMDIVNSLLDGFSRKFKLEVNERFPYMTRTGFEIKEIFSDDDIDTIINNHPIIVAKIRTLINIDKFNDTPEKISSVDNRLIIKTKDDATFNLSLEYYLNCSGTIREMWEDFDRSSEDFDISVPFSATTIRSLLADDLLIEDDFIEVFDAILFFDFHFNVIDYTRLLIKVFEQTVHPDLRNIGGLNVNKIINQYVDKVPIQERLMVLIKNRDLYQYDLVYFFASSCVKHNEYKNKDDEIERFVSFFDAVIRRISDRPTEEEISTDEKEILLQHISLIRYLKIFIDNN